jgi:TM2 domain-containing membrane protein YozV
MNLKKTIILSLSFSFFIIGVHQIIVKGLIDAYLFMMISTSLFLYYVFLKKINKPKNDKTQNNLKKL